MDLFKPYIDNEIYKVIDDYDLIKVTSMIDNGFDIDFIGIYGTPLIYAIKKYRTNIANRLIELGANVNFGTINIFPLLQTCITGNMEIFNCLLAYDVDVHVTDYVGNNALHYAAYNNRIEIIERLIALGVDINHKNQDNLPPLYDAILTYNYGLAKCLIKHGAIIDDGSFFQALSYGDIDIITYMLDHGANVDVDVGVYIKLNQDVIDLLDLYRSFNVKESAE